jgi:hypothetical protein
MDAWTVAYVVFRFFWDGVGLHITCIIISGDDIMMKIMLFDMFVQFCALQRLGYRYRNSITVK